MPTICSLRLRFFCGFVWIQVLGLVGVLVGCGGLWRDLWLGVGLVP